MKDYLVELVRQTSSPAEGRNLAREYLQARILAALQRAGAMIPLAFHGGTALRFLYAHGRYSEDLNFALEGNRQGYNFRDYLQAIRTELTPEGYTVELKLSDQKQFTARLCVFLDCFTIWDYPHIKARYWRSSWKWRPTHRLGPAWRQAWYVVLSFFSFTIMIKPHCYQASCMRSYKGHIPRGVTSMICSGT